MNRIYWGLLCAGIMSLTLGFYPGVGIARVDVNVRVGSPPPLTIARPPEVVVIPHTYVYYAPDVGGDLFFYQGYWYRPYGGHWFRAGNYGGPWRYLEDSRMPRALFHLPPDYRTVAGYRQIPYRDLHRNWRAWERDRYWERHGWNRQEREEREHGIAPPYRGGYGHDWDRGRW